MFNSERQLSTERRYMSQLTMPHVSPEVLSFLHVSTILETSSPFTC